MSSIYSAEVRKVAEREGVTDLRAYYIVKSRHEIQGRMSERFASLAAERATKDAAAHMNMTFSRPSVWQRLWNKIENYMKGRYDYS